MSRLHNGWLCDLGMTDEKLFPIAVSCFASTSTLSLNFIDESAFD